ACDSSMAPSPSSGLWAQAALRITVESIQIAGPRPRFCMSSHPLARVPSPSGYGTYAPHIGRWRRRKGRRSGICNLVVPCRATVTEVGILRYRRSSNDLALGWADVGKARLGHPTDVSMRRVGT